MAAATPRGTDSSRMMMKAAPASSAEAATRWPISWATEVCRTNDCPRSPCSARFNQSPYWSKNGRSSPIRWRTCSIAAGVTSLRLSSRRASSSAGSPGAFDTRVKIRNESASSVGAAITSRRMTYRPIRGLLRLGEAEPGLVRVRRVGVAQVDLRRHAVDAVGACQGDDDVGVVDEDLHHLGGKLLDLTCGRSSEGLVGQSVEVGPRGKLGGVGVFRVHAQDREEGRVPIVLVRPFEVEVEVALAAVVEGVAGGGIGRGHDLHLDPHRLELRLDELAAPSRGVRLSQQLHGQAPAILDTDAVGTGLPTSAIEDRGGLLGVERR